MQSTGAVNLWTWGPINVPAGAAIYAVAAFEVVYWYGGRPTYAWKYVRSDTSPGVADSYCYYP